jgi:hypothetical protein
MANSAPAYETPEIIESFDAFEVMGSGEGLEVFTVGCGSQVSALCIPK